MFSIYYTKQNNNNIINIVITFMVNVVNECSQHIVVQTEKIGGEWEEDITIMVIILI